MIRSFINKLNERYNTFGRDKQLIWLVAFCLVFLSLLVVTVRYVDFDIKSYYAEVPVHIGRPSGSEFKDTTKHQKQ